MRRRQFLRCLPLIAALACAPGLARAASFDEIRASGLLKVAVYRDYPPFSFVADGELKGIDVDLARAIGKAFGLQVNFMLLTAADDIDGDLRNAVWKGHYLGGGTADLMLHVPYDTALAARNGNAVLFGAYCHDSLAWASRDSAPGSTLQIDTAAIGVENDSLADLYLASLQGGRLRVALRHYPTLPAAARALLAGEVGAVYGTRSELDWALAGSSVRPVPIATPGLLKPRWEIGMATKESLHDLAYAAGDVLERLSQQGELAAIFQRYGVDFEAADPH